MKKSKEFKEKALFIIESMCSEESTMLTKFARDERGNITLVPDKFREFIDQIYTLAHAATDTDCEHPEWEKNIEDVYMAMIKRDLI